MSELKAVKASEFPLKSSLFWSNNGQVESTWGLLKKNATDAWINRLIQWHTEQSLNTAVFLTYNRDPNCFVTPFVQTYGPNVDWVEVTRWMKLFKLGQQGSNLIPCLFSDDDSETANNIAFHNYYVPGACVALGPFSRAICIGLEMNERFSLAAMEHIIELCHTYTDKPVVVHMQWNTITRLPRGLDGLIYEHPWQPDKGPTHSADEVASIGAQVIARAGIPVGFNEYTLWPWEEHGRNQTRALAKLPCWLIGGPL